MACFNVMAWLIKSYGPPKAPKVPSPLHRTPLLSDIFLHPSDPRAPGQWAESVFTDIKHQCAMESWAVQIADPNDPNTVLKDMSSRKHQDNPAAEPYQVDRYGRPVILFEKESCHVPGDFAARIILKLSDLKLMTYAPPNSTETSSSEASPSDASQALLSTLVSAAHSGQGFHLLPLKRTIRQRYLGTNNPVSWSSKHIQRRLIFGACLGLRALNRSPEQIIAAYGCLTRPGQRHQIASACHQIDTYQADLNILQLMCASPRRRVGLVKQTKVA